MSLLRRAMQKNLLAIQILKVVFDCILPILVTVCCVYLVGNDSESYNTDIFVDFGDTGKILLTHCIIQPLYCIAKRGSAHSAPQQTGLPTSHVDCVTERKYFIMYSSCKSKNQYGIMWVREHQLTHVLICCSGRALECSNVKILIHQIEI